MDVVSAVVASEEAASGGLSVSPYAFGALAFITLTVLLVITVMLKVGKDG